ncbi:hypothetical protein FOZ62_029787, partial [Perkinsus olseni]
SPFPVLPVLPQQRQRSGIPSRDYLGVCYGCDEPRCLGGDNVLPEPCGGPPYRSGPGKL